MHIHLLGFLKKRSLCCAGYSLLELAMVIGVSGLVLSSGAAAYNLYRRNEATNSTASNINILMNTTSNYLLRHGRYPCPAPLDVPKTDPQYGMPVDCLAAPISALDPGECDHGICVEESERQVQVGVDGGGAPIMERPRVIRGAVPFRVLNKPEYLAYDGHKSRMEYVVTARLTDALLYNKDHGGISVVDGQATPRSVSTPPASVHYLYMSHGPDREGAYSSQGRMGVPCGAELDGENCNTSDTQPLAVYRVMEQNTASGAQNFDDQVKFYASISTPLWIAADEEGYHIRDTGLADSVGIGKEPDAAYKLDVNGAIRAKETANATHICSQDGTGCFTTDLIAGQRPEMDCTNPAHPSYDATKPYVKRVIDGKVECTDEVQIRCPDNKFMSGLNPDGSLRCLAEPVGCPSQTVDLCWITATATYDKETLPAGFHNQTFTTKVSGVSYQDHYRCDNGAWAKYSYSGSCTCLPSDTTVPSTCNSDNNGLWTGTRDLRTVKVCDPVPKTTYTYVNNTCQCTPGFKPSWSACPKYYTGTGMNFTREWICTSPTSGTFKPPVLVSSDCTCTPFYEYRQIDCQVAYSGKITQKRLISCPADTTKDGIPGSWEFHDSNCTCVGASKNQNLPCAPGYSGQIVETQTYDCGTDSWGPWQQTANNCTKNVYYWKRKSTQNGPYANPSGVQEGGTCNIFNAETACWANAPGGQYYHFSTCACE